MAPKSKPDPSSTNLDLAAVAPERIKDLRVLASSPICPACGGAGTVPGTTNGSRCANCYGLGRTGARLPEDMPEGA